MAMNDEQFEAVVCEFSLTVGHVFDLSAAYMTPAQTHQLLGALSGVLADLMERHIGRAAMVESFIELGDFYREQGVGEGALQ